MTKTCVGLAILATGMLLGLMFGRQANRPAAAGDPAVTTVAGPTLQSIQSLALLVTTQVTVSDVELTRLQGYTGAAKAALLVRGDFTIGTDLSRAKLTDVNPAKQTAVITLRTPVPDRPRVDLSRSKLVALGTEGLWGLLPGQDTQTVVAGEAYRQAQQVLGQESRDPAWRDQAQRQAERVIDTFTKSFAWTVEVRWADG